MESRARTIKNKLIRRSLKLNTHPERPLFINEYSFDGPPKGRVYAKYPFKYTVQKGKSYLWCTCGYSNTQVSNNRI